MFLSFRCATLLIVSAAAGNAFQDSAAGASPADLFPLKYTALLGSGANIAAIAVGADGSVFVTGAATAALPATRGAFQTEYKPAVCNALSHASFSCPVAFAAKLTPDGTSLAYLTYLGASNGAGRGISVDASGNAWIGGNVLSSDLPVTPGAFQTAVRSGSVNNGFVLKLSPDGSRVLFASYLGGSGSSNVLASQAMDAAGNLYVAGTTNSIDFPVTANALQRDSGEAEFPAASFVARFDPSGRVLYSTYFHGAKGSETVVYSVAVDGAGNAVLAGLHAGGSLPVSPGAFQASASGNSRYAGFAAKLDSAGSRLLYCTYLPADAGWTLAADRQGNAYISGNTRLVKLNAAGTTSIYSTPLDGSVSVLRVAVDRAGAVVIIGQTNAFDFPATPGALRQCNPRGSWGSTGVLLKLDANGSRPLYATYLGADLLWAVAVDDAGDIYVGGQDAALMPIVPGSFGWNGGGAFVAKLTPAPLPAGTVSCVASAASRSARAVAPGEIVDIFGRGIGPAQAASMAGVQVFFNGTPAPLLWAGPDQIRAVVPFEAGPASLDWTGSVNIQVLNGSTAAQPFTMPIAALEPAIFTVDGKPTGQALMIHEDGTVNSKENPALQGSIVTIYATGLNATSPPLETGAIAPGAARLALESALQIFSPNFGPVEITYAGAAPGFVAGLTQINFRLPSPIFHGMAPLWLNAGKSASQVGVYFYSQ